MLIPDRCPPKCLTIHIVRETNTEDSLMNPLPEATQATRIPTEEIPISAETTSISTDEALIEEMRSARLMGGFLLLLVPVVYFFPLVAVVRPWMKDWGFHPDYHWHLVLWMTLTLGPIVYNALVLRCFLFQRARFTYLIIALIWCILSLVEFGAGIYAHIDEVIGLSDVE